MLAGIRQIADNHLKLVEGAVSFDVGDKNLFNCCEIELVPPDRQSVRLGARNDLERCPVRLAVPSSSFRRSTSPSSRRLT